MSATPPDICKKLEAYPAVFITGTDTEVGKTYCTALLMKHLIKEAIDVNPFKIISAGIDPKTGVNEDAQVLYEACDKRFSIHQINPIVFAPPIAPHIAAKQVGQTITFNQLDKEFDQATALTKLTLVEGAGGWHLPVNDEQLLSEWVGKKNMPVILVVAIRLGCLNHALLTAEAIQNSGCQLIGWVANFVDEKPNAVSLENLRYIEAQFEKRFNANRLFTVLPNQAVL
jgi:dethiobiotin synthetase